MEKKIPEKIIVDTIEEEDKEIYRMILEQKPQNEIMQIEFIVNGVSRHHNASYISKIKKKFENKNSENFNDESYKEAKVLELYQNGYDRVRAKIKTRYNTELIERVWNQYVTWKEIKIISKPIFDAFITSTLKMEQRYNDPTVSISDIDIELAKGYFTSMVDDDLRVDFN